MIFIYGYQAFSGDQEEHLPYALALNDPSLYTHDYLVSYQLEHITVRYFFAHTMAFLFRYFPEQETIFAVYVFNLALTIMPLLRLCSRRSDHPIVLPMAGAAFVLFSRFTIGGNALSDVQLTCSSFAIAFCAWAIDFYDRKKPVTAAFLCAFASLFQVLFGLQLIGLLLLVQLFNAYNRLKNRWKTSLMMLLGYALPAAFMLVPLIKQQTGHAIQPDLFHSLLFKYRNAHHYMPQCFPLSDYTKTIALWGLAGLSLRRTEHYFRAWFTLLAGGVILFCLVYVALFSFAGVAAIGKLQAFKSTVFMTYLALVPLVLFIGEKTGGIKLFSILNRWWVTSIFIGTLFLFITDKSFLPEYKWQNRYQIGTYEQDDLGQMHNWIRNNTPKDAVFISFASDVSFLCETRRSTLVAYKGIVHTPDFMLSWYEKMLAVYRVPMIEDACSQNIIATADSTYQNVPDSAISKQFHFDFRLWQSEPIPGSGPEVHRQGDYVLTRIED